MKIIDQLTALRIYYTQREVGHSTLVKEGLYHYQGDMFLVVNTMKEAQQFNTNPKDVISLNNMDKLRGHNRPLIFDNNAMVTIISESMDTILKQEKIIADFKNMESYYTLQKEYGTLLDSYRRKSQEAFNKAGEIHRLKLEIKQLRKYNILIPIRDFFKQFQNAR
jgi:hypothetical protein